MRKSDFSRGHCTSILNIISQLYCMIIQNMVYQVAIIQSMTQIILCQCQLEIFTMVQLDGRNLKPSIQCLRILIVIVRYQLQLIYYSLQLKLQKPWNKLSPGGTSKLEHVAAQYKTINTDSYSQHFDPVIVEYSQL